MLHCHLFVPYSHSCRVFESALGFFVVPLVSGAWSVHSKPDAQLANSGLGLEDFCLTSSRIQILPRAFASACDADLHTGMALHPASSETLYSRAHPITKFVLLARWKLCVAWLYYDGTWRRSSAAVEPL